MPYCPECDATREAGGYCPDCGSALVQAAKGSADREDDGQSGEPPIAVAPEATDEADQTDYFTKGPISFAFTYPQSDGWAPIIITPLLLFFSFLILPMLLVYGYSYRLGRAALREDPVAPQYDEWVQLLVDGVLLFLVTIPFVIVVMFVGVLPLILAIEIGSIGLGFIAAVMYLAAGYIGGGIVPTFMATGSVIETYRGGRFLRFVTTISYLKALLLIIGVQIGVWVVIAGITIGLFLTLVGILLIPVVYFVATPFMLFLPYLLFAYYYREAVATGAVDGLPEDAELAASF